MQFLSIQFLGFFLLVGVILYFLPGKWRWLWLLITSYIFFLSWSQEYFFVLLAITLISYMMALFMERTSKRRLRLLFLIIGLAGGLGPIFYFKYLNYVSWLFSKLTSSIDLYFRLPTTDLIAPIGISFYTLQIIAYLFDVYRGQQKAEKHVGRFALFVSFFPQLVSGPIGRAKSLLGQYQSLHPPNTDEFRDGINRIFIGSFQKFVIADRIATLISKVFDQPNEYHSLTLIVAAYLFSIQIYCDFAGYSHIAIGIAKILGIDLPENFNFPYLAKDFIEFWNRWHISFSTWLRDYIFYPISRALRKTWRQRNHMINIILPPFVTMLVSGVWHGAGINFLFWGMFHGIMLILSGITSNWRRRFTEKRGKTTQWVFKALQLLVTFHLITLSWIVFRTNSIIDAIVFYKKMFLIETLAIDYGQKEILVGIIVLISFLIGEYLQFKQIFFDWIKTQKILIRWSFYFAIIFILLFMGEFQGSEPFLYAQF